MMSFYFMENIITEDSVPEILADQNIRVQYNQVAYIFGKNNEKRNEVLQEITDKKALRFSVSPGQVFDLILF